ncbi:uncharacterized protein EDB91DRAFT_1099687 [Suillus paluster]|uniref:uncharacterized protein n=1 Tax=Suillus paluster TaxID=48578 RepID=UPI001B87755E|nr:uncharacterized protein EDB91DRAFT_1099687 [Suillus paluster]KAG1753752.1 hypothetical protein EDB91DRAFT_1099687 [Suillus paluster]
MCSYQTPQGVVHGFQWVPVDAIQILTGPQLPNVTSPQLAGVYPHDRADQGFAAGSRGPVFFGREDEVVLEKWYDRAPYRPAGAFSIPPIVKPHEILPSTYPNGPDPIAKAAYMYVPQAPSPMPPLWHPRSPYTRPPSRARSPGHYQRLRSPYPPQRTPFVPPSQLHPMPGAPARPVFHSSSRIPGAATGEESSQLSVPEAFSRMPDAAQPYTPFSVTRIQGMDTFYRRIPSMPRVLDTHDVRHQDWSRFMNDLALAWTGKMPLPEFARGLPPAELAAVQINLWNKSFFRARLVEVVLYLGRERRSGPLAGSVDDQLPLPESERTEGRERKYSLYLTCVARAGSYVAGHNPFGSTYYYS